MNAAVDESGKLLDPEAEVRKLKDLVQKLTEERNQYLRVKENIKDTNVQNTNHILQNTALHDNVDSEQNYKSTLKESLNSEVALDEVDLLDVTNLENLEEEDSWLYASPKKSSSPEKCVSPYKWLREEFDRPSPEIESARRTLIYKLDDLSRFPRSPSTGTLGSPISPVSTPTSQGDAPHMVHAASTGNMPSIRQPLLGVQKASRIDTSTFTRPKKNRPPINNDNKLGPDSPDSSPRDTPERNNNDGYRGIVDGYKRAGDRHRPSGDGYRPSVDENANGHSGTSSGSVDSLGITHKMEDVMDVQVVARMQEDSLRQSMNSPYTSRKLFSDEVTDDVLDDPAALSRSLNHSSGGLLDGFESTVFNSSGRSSPGRFDSEMYQSAKRSNNSLASLSSNSTSPPNSQYGSQYLDHRSQAVLNSETHRRSMPNLARGQQALSTLPSRGSESRLRERNTPSPSSKLAASSNQHNMRQTGGNSRQSIGTPGQKQLRGPGRANASPSRTLSPNRTMSPQRMVSSQRNYSPQRGYSPQRNDSAGRNLSPQRTQAHRHASPGRTLSPPRVSAQRNASPGRTLSPQRVQRNASPGRTLSPQRSGIPTPGRTGIPRPASHSKLPAPRRSSIPSVRRSLQTPRTNDESWKDGCY